MGTANEIYIGGFTSSSVKRKRFDLGTYGFYVTSKGIFLIRSSKALQLTMLSLLFTLNALAISDIVVFFFLRSTPYGFLVNPLFNPLFWIEEAFLFIIIGSSWYRNFSEVPIEELEKRKVWEVERDQISSLETVRSDLSTSRLEIHLKNGEERSILFAVAGSLDRARAFLPRKK